MKILHVMPTVDPANGGPVEAVSQMARNLTARGHVVEIVCLDAPDRPFIARYPAKVYAVGPGSGSYLFSTKLIPWLRRHAQGYDTVIINGIWQFNCFGAWLGLPRGVPYYVFTHGMLDPWFKRNYPLKHLKKWLYWPWAVYPVLRGASGVLFTCEEERLLARESFWLYRVKERVVKYGTATPPKIDEGAKQEFLARFPQVRGKRNLLFISRIHEKKGCDLLIQAFARVSAVDPALRLMMVGTGEEGFVAGLKDLAERLGVSDRITWTGMLTGTAKWSAFACCEVFVLPSHQENFGIAVVEALACGLPVLISRSINIWREIEAERAGMAEEDTLDGTEKNLRRYLNLSAQERTAYRARAAAAFDKLFTIDAACSSVLQVIVPIPA